MKLPKRAPTLTELWKEGFPDGFFAHWKTPGYESMLAKANAEAWNFEECGYRAKTIGVTPEQFWLQVKLSRLSNRVFIPLEDKKRQPFSFATLPTMAAYLHEIDLSLGGMVLSRHTKLEDKPSRQRYLVRSLQEEAIASSLIEGAVVTRADAREMIRSNRTPKTHGERMVFNNYRTVRVLHERKDERMTPGFLCEIQRSLTDGAIDKPGGEGRFRRPDEYVRIVDEEETPVFEPPPADELEMRMNLFCEFANAKPEFQPGEPFIHPVLRAIVLHFWIGYDHPFVDGNGRTARALFYWSMLRQGYWLTEYVSISRIIQQQVRQYYRAYLDTEQDENDLTYFVMYHLRVISRGIQELKAYLTEKQDEVTKQIDLVRLGLNTRQIALVTKALEEPATRFTYESHAHSHGVTRATARTDLLNLRRRALFELIRNGRTFEFIAHADIDERIARLKQKIPKR
jgi:Fic family protein